MITQMYRKEILRQTHCNKRLRHIVQALCHIVKQLCHIVHLTFVGCF